MAIKICPECGGKVAESRFSCPHCDHRFRVVYVCDDCGKEYNDMMGECPECGSQSFSNSRNTKVISTPIPVINESCSTSSPQRLYPQIDFTSYEDFKQSIVAYQKFYIADGETITLYCLNLEEKREGSSKEWKFDLYALYENKKDTTPEIINITVEWDTYKSDKVKKYVFTNEFDKSSFITLKSYYESPKIKIEIKSTYIKLEISGKTDPISARFTLE